MSNRAWKLLFLLAVTSFFLFSGFGGCNGGGGGFKSKSTPPPPCPPSLPPPGGFCVAVCDQNMNGIQVPHVQATVNGSNTGVPIQGLTPVGSVDSFAFNGGGCRLGLAPVLSRMHD